MTGFAGRGVRAAEHAVTRAAADGRDLAKVAVVEMSSTSRRSEVKPR
jgi:hypothetical protein